MVVCELTDCRELLIEQYVGIGLNLRGNLRWSRLFGSSSQSIDMKLDQVDLHAGYLLGQADLYQEVAAIASFEHKVANSD